jgi:hypothetical protein
MIFKFVSDPFPLLATEWKRRIISITARPPACMTVRGKVVRSNSLENGGFCLGIEFDKVQEKLSSVVFENH